MATLRLAGALILLAFVATSHALGADLSNCDASGSIVLPVTSVADIAGRLAYASVSTRTLTSRSDTPRTSS